MKDNGTGWQKALLLPKEKMCSFHRNLLDSMPKEVQKAREIRVGRVFEVQLMNGFCLDPDDRSIRLDSKDCLPLRVKDGDEVAGCFSCEFSMD